MSTPRSREALDELREKVLRAQAAAATNPLWELGIPELETLAKDHKPGENHNGWENPYPKADPRSILLEYQFYNFHDRARFKQCLQGRQTGKDFTGQGEIIDDCKSRKTEWMVVAPSERQSLDSLDQGKMWAVAFDLAIEDEDVQKEGLHPESLIKSSEITLAGGSRVRAVPGRPDTVRGRSANIFLTEVDFFENALATWRALLPSITNSLRGGEKRVRLVSTPNGKGSLMEKIYKKGPGKKMAWSKHLVTIYHAVLMGMPVSVEEIREALDDEDGFNQECLCMFLDLASVLLPYDLMAPCETEEATVELNVAAIQNMEHPCYLGVDIGRKHDLTVFWIKQRVAEQLITRGVIELHKTPFREQEAELFDLLRSFPNIRRACIDSTGIGAMLAENAAADFGSYRVEECPFSAQFKQDIFLPLRGRFEDRTIEIPISRTIREDLHSLQKVTTSAGNIRIAATRNEDGHADRGTALALACHASDNEEVALPPRAFGKSKRGEATRNRRERRTQGV